MHWNVISQRGHRDDIQEDLIVADGQRGFPKVTASLVTCREGRYQGIKEGKLAIRVSTEQNPRSDHGNAKYAEDEERFKVLLFASGSGSIAIRRLAAQFVQKFATRFPSLLEPTVRSQLQLAQETSEESDVYFETVAREICVKGFPSLVSFAISCGASGASAANEIISFVFQQLHGRPTSTFSVDNDLANSLIKIFCAAPKLTLGACLQGLATGDPSLHDITVVFLQHLSQEVEALVIPVLHSQPEVERWLVESVRHFRRGMLQNGYQEQVSKQAWPALEDIIRNLHTFTPADLELNPKPPPPPPTLNKAGYGGSSSPATPQGYKGASPGAASTLHYQSLQLTPPAMLHSPAPLPMHSRVKVQELHALSPQAQQERQHQHQHQQRQGGGQHRQAASSWQSGSPHGGSHTPQRQPNQRGGMQQPSPLARNSGSGGGTVNGGSDPGMAPVVAEAEMNAMPVGRELHIAGLGPSVREEVVREVCGRHGAIERVLYPARGRGQGAVVVEFVSTGDAVRAWEELRGGNFHGRPLSVQFGEQAHPGSVRARQWQHIWITGLSGLSPEAGRKHVLKELSDNGFALPKSMSWAGQGLLLEYHSKFAQAVLTKFQARRGASTGGVATPVDMDTTPGPGLHRKSGQTPANPTNLLTPGGMQAQGAGMGRGDGGAEAGIGCILWVAQVGNDVREDDLGRAFAAFGELRNVAMLRGRKCAVVEFFKPEAAKAAKAQLHGVRVCNSSLHIEYKRGTGPGGGSSMLSQPAMGPLAIAGPGGGSPMLAPPAMGHMAGAAVHSPMQHMPAGAREAAGTPQGRMLGVPGYAGGVEGGVGGPGEHTTSPRWGPGQGNPDVAMSVPPPPPLPQGVNDGHQADLEQQHRGGRHGQATRGASGGGSQGGKGAGGGRGEGHGSSGMDAGAGR
ncbi:hypothetical protein CYMTET_16632 [Cymbomonas tetramitiformis]|uniref:RRM domain-containing protein n=1 Tax=Cymbomonas tetramitiformis TaxID=36881 RepID=A0AAE0L7R2_9CHLO|nr:hypothetical protein CYMTET_16632 [Cymbomonas tetramitiformis]